MQASIYQTEIILAVQQRLKAQHKKGLIVEALAGCGKSTILWMVAQELQRAGYKPTEVVALVFGKKNQLDLQTKFRTKIGSEWGASVRTIHSLCYEIYRSALGIEHKRVKFERSKYKEIAQKFELIPVESEYRSTPGSLLEDGLIYESADFLGLLEKLRLYCLDATIEHVEFLTDLYKLGIKNIPQVATAAAKCLSQGLKSATGNQYQIDTTDMVWVPWVLREDARFAGAMKKKREQLRVLALDEAQDTDLLQIEVLTELIDPQRSFLIGVGDRQQAVYFFRGCLSDGLERITSRFDGENLPLPICYRCGVKHLELVREIFPLIPIQPRPDAPQGEIRVIWEKDFLKIFENSALQYMGVCRKNAPLTIAAIKLLAAGKPAKIKDKNIGGRLVSRVREICLRRKYNPDNFPAALHEYEATQRKMLAKFPDGEAKLGDLQDLLESIRALFQAYEPKTLKAWEELVNKIFDESGYSPISLYSIHSGKGGEGQVSFILNPDELPLEHPKQVEQEREQEQHLLYVALTRTLADGVDGAGVLCLVVREDESSEGKPLYPTWLPVKYRTLKVDAKHSAVDKDSSPSRPETASSDYKQLDNSEDEDLEPGWSELTDKIQKTVASDFLVTNLDVAVANNCSQVPDLGPPALPVNQFPIFTNNCSLESLDLEDLEEKIKRGFNLTRDFCDCGKALMLVRDYEPPLYYPEFRTFESYCKERFKKSVRAAQYFMSAAALVDNLLMAECAIIPTSESQVRAIATLEAEQQVEIWQHACTHFEGKVPTANQVKKSRAIILGEVEPTETTFATSIEDGSAIATPVVTKYNVLPEPTALLERLKSRIKGTKVSLQDVEVLLELVIEMTKK